MNLQGGASKKERSVVCVCGVVVVGVMFGLMWLLGCVDNSGFVGCDVGMGRQRTTHSTGGGREREK